MLRSLLLLTVILITTVTEVLAGYEDNARNGTSCSNHLGSFPSLAAIESILAVSFLARAHLPSEVEAAFRASSDAASLGGTMPGGYVVAPVLLAAGSSAEQVAMVSHFGAALIVDGISRDLAAVSSQKLREESTTWPSYPMQVIHQGFTSREEGRREPLRMDYPLDLETEVGQQLVEAIVGRTAEMLESLLGPDPQLVEASVLITYPGAPTQPRHADSNEWFLAKDPAQGSARMVTLFVPLVDVDEDMGALDVWLGTHTFYSYYDEAQAGYFGGKGSAMRMAVPAGSIIVIDSRVQHRGSANTSNRVRDVAYVTFLSRLGKPPRGSTFSLRGQYKQAISLEDIKDRSYSSVCSQSEEAG